MGGNSICSWDDAKRESNLQKHLYDFADIEQVFDGRFSLTTMDDRFDYGEQRYNMLVGLRGRIINVTFNPRNDRFHLIRYGLQVATKGRSTMPDSKTADVGRTDWTKIDALTDEHIERMADSDGENPASNEIHWAESLVGLPPARTSVDVEFDQDVVDWFKSQGRGYKMRMNAALRHYMEAHRKAG